MTPDEAIHEITEAYRIKFGELPAKDEQGLILHFAPQVAAGETFYWVEGLPRSLVLPTPSGLGHGGQNYPPHHSSEDLIRSRR